MGGRGKMWKMLEIRMFGRVGCQTFIASISIVVAITLTLLLLAKLYDTKNLLNEAKDLSSLINNVGLLVLIKTYRSNAIFDVE